jgi:hypothetical protein
MRCAAKSCPELGIDPHTWAAYHKSHINKTMAVAFTAFAFINNIENGGTALKLGLFRAQSHKIAKKMVRKSIRQPDRRLRQNGDIVRSKGDVYRIECAVTGSDVGTAENPKFPLLNLFHDFIFPQVEELVRPGGRFAGYTPIIQGNNAGPHNDGEYLRFVNEYCETRSRHWKPQAPQMPHTCMNVLDL